MRRFAIDLKPVKGMLYADFGKLQTASFRFKLQVIANNKSYNLNIVTLTRGNYLFKIEMN